MKPDGIAVIFSNQPFTTQLISSNIKNFRYCWYWLKPYATGFAYARYQPMRRVEDISVFYKKWAKYNPQDLKVIKAAKPVKKKVCEREVVYKQDTLLKSYTPRFTNWPKNVLEYGPDKERGLHPTQKPVPLLEYLIKTYTNPGDTVLDNCMGSGSTGVAVQRVGSRHFIGIERDKAYFEIAQKRIRGDLKENEDNGNAQNIEIITDRK